MKRESFYPPRRTPRWLRRSFAAGLLGCLAGGCAAQGWNVPTDPSSDFTAHVDSSGLVIDHNLDGSRERVAAGHASLFAPGPRYVVQSQGKTVATLWMDDLDHLTVRRGDSDEAPVIASVETTWNGDLLRLALHGAGGTELSTSRFRRIDPHRVPSALSARVATVLDVEGSYVAEVRDSRGNPIGWIRVEVDPSVGTPRIYHAELPSGVDPELMVGATALLNADLGEIQRNAQDVYRGN